MILISLLTFFILIYIYRVYINFAKKKQLGQFIRKEGPDLHNYKEGTPTAGGIFFTLTISILSLIAFFINKEPVYLIVSLSSIMYSLIGFIDDFLSINKKESTGLKSFEKLLLQLIISTIIFFVINHFNPHNYTTLPFFNIKLNFGILYPIWVILYLSGMSNASNLTDGLDGLSGGTYIISAFFTVLITPAPKELLFILIIPVSAYLMFNIKPAKIFMGDTGSLALGGIIGSIAVYYSIEFFTIFTCFIFLSEMFSVIIQVSSYKIRNKRVFLMSPIHHHFELKKWSEERVVMYFWIINFLMGLIAIGGLK